jgi:GAF domain-containing protein
MGNARFEASELGEAPPAAGIYAATISNARLRRSQGGNRMVHVVHAVDGVAPGQDRIAEYFVLEGASPRGLALARRRLVELYRACGMDPRPGDEIVPAELVGARLEVRVEHETFQGEVRLRVVAHRPIGAGSVDGVPF